jgi:CheY-like chemotaxis protein
VVDDSPSARKLLQQLLLRIGYELPNIRLATSPREALVLFTQWKPDVVFLDLELRAAAEEIGGTGAKEPGTGAELAFHFLARNPAVKVIICSATDADTTQVRDLVREGKVLAMVKPLMASKIQDALNVTPPVRSKSR